MAPANVIPQAFKRPVVGAAACHLLLAVALFHAAWEAPAYRWIGGCCDPEQAMWWLRWMPYVFTHPQNPLFTHLLNAPYGVNLMWNTSQLFSSLILSPVTALWGVIVSYNVLVTLALAVSGLACFVLLRRWCSVFAALVGSLLYEFSPYMLGVALGHSQLVVAFTPPLLLLCLDTLLNHPERSARWSGVWIGLLAAVQLMISEEVLATEVLAGAILAVTVLALRPQLLLARRERIVQGALVALGVFVVVAGFPLLEQLTGPERISGNFQSTARFSTDLLNLIAPTNVEWIAPTAAIRATAHFDAGLSLEAVGYLGIPLIVLLVFVVIRHRHELVVKAAGTTAAVLTLLSLGPVLLVNNDRTGVWLPWSLLSHLPAFRAILPSRLMVYVFLAAAVLVAVFIDRSGGYRHQAGRIAAAAGAAIALIPLIPRPVFLTVQAGTTARDAVPVPALVADWRQASLPDGSNVLVAPLVTDGQEARAMLWQAVAGLRFAMPQGYFYGPTSNAQHGFVALPGLLANLMAQVQDRGSVIVATGEVRRAMLQELRRRHVAAVAVGPMFYQNQMVQAFTDLFREAPEIIGGVFMWRDVARLDGAVR